VRLEALGQVIDSVQNTKVATWYNGIDSMVLAIQRQPAPTPLRWWTTFSAFCPPFAKRFPNPSIWKRFTDSSIAIRDSVDDVKFTLYLTLALVVM